MKPTKTQLLAMNEHLERLRKEAQDHIDRPIGDYLDGYYAGKYNGAVLTYWLIGYIDYTEAARRTDLLDYHLDCTEPMG